MVVLRGQGNADDPATQYTVSGFGHTPGPFPKAEIGEWDMNYLAEKLREGQWHALLLKAVLKGWACYEVGAGDGSWQLLHPSDSTNFIIKATVNGLPACPNAETYERIRKAVEGE